MHLSEKLPAITRSRATPRQPAYRKDGDEHEDQRVGDESEPVVLADFEGVGKEGHPGDGEPCEEERRTRNEERGTRAADKKEETEREDEHVGEDEKPAGVEQALQVVEGRLG
jgi:hypothetical protein